MRSGTYAYHERYRGFVLCAVLLLALTFAAAGCGGNGSGGAEDGAAAEGTALSEGGSLGEGAVSFSFTVVDAEGNETAFEIHTDQTTVGDALQELGLIDGEEGEYGLYVKTVNGITADYDADGAYWAFYVDGEYAASGVDATEIEEGRSYALCVERG